MQAALCQTRAFTLPITHTPEGPVNRPAERRRGLGVPRGQYTLSGRTGVVQPGRIPISQGVQRPAGLGSHDGRALDEARLNWFSPLPPGRAFSRDPRPGALAWRTGLSQGFPGVGMLDSDCPSALVPRSQIPSPGRAPWDGCQEEALLQAEMASAAEAVSLRRSGTQAWVRLLQSPGNSA